MKARCREAPIAVRPVGGYAKYLVTKTVHSGPPDIHRSRGCIVGLITKRIRDSKGGTTVHPNAECAEYLKLETVLGGVPEIP